jgi:hypothetical protein
VFSATYSAAQYRLRMIENDNMVEWYPLISKQEIDLYKYRFWEYSRDLKKTESFGNILKEHGIRRTERILSIPDYSFNISLYFMDQKGFGITREHLEMDSTVTDLFKGRDVHYVVLSDTSLKKTRAFQKLAVHLEPFFREGEMQVFKVKSTFR